MKMCENCKHWIQMKELEGKCVLYGLKHCAYTPAEATCDEWEEDDDGHNNSLRTGFDTRRLVRGDSDRGAGRRKR